MVTTVISATTDGFTTLDSGDTFLLLQGITNHSNFDPVRDADLKSTQKINVQIDGNLIGVNGNAINFDDPLGEGSLITIGQTGSISSYGDVGIGNGIFLAHSTGRIVNYGTITANGDGIELAATDISVENYGTITGDRAIANDLFPANTSIYNSGILSGSTGVIKTAGALTLINSGQIRLTAPPQFTASIETSNDRDSINNSGEITGNISLEGGSDTLVNSGYINGTIITGAGNDTVTNSGLIEGNIILGDGNNTYDGRFGEVTGSINAGAGGTTILGGEAIEKVGFSGRGNTIKVGGGDDTVTGHFSIGQINTLDGGSGVDSLNISTIFVTSDLVFDMRTGLFTLPNQTTQSFENFENFNLLAHFGAATVLGTLGDNDISVNANGGGTIKGFFGNDILTGNNTAVNIDGGGGDDVLTGGATGNDVLNGGTGDDTVFGRGGNDKIFGAAGDDTLNGNDGNDRIKGNQGNDILNGGAGNDDLFGGSGNDTITGGAGDDILRGEAGADIFVFQTGANIDRIRDWQDDSDHIDLTSYNFADATTALTQFIQQGANVRFVDGSDTLVIEGVQLADITAADLIL